jgi:glycosyltransferase involved in cell wall biosynthesis
MQTPTLSVVIPSYKDPLLHKTIESLLKNATGPIEVIAVLDGYWTNVVNDPRVRVVHYGETRGMRDAINGGVSIARGRYIMRTDEHCDFCPGYDTILTSQIEDNWIVVPRRYALDPETWTRMPDVRAVDYEKLTILASHQKFSGLEWRSRAIERAHIPLDETMAMQGSCWVMSRHWWDTVIGRLDSTGYGTHYQDSVEMSMKTWQAGGKLMVNKHAWYAHKHRKFPRTHSYGGQAARESWAHALELWKPYYDAVIAPRWFA